MIKSSSQYSPKFGLIIQFLFLHSVRGISQPLDRRCLHSKPFIESLTSEHDKLVQMGIIRSSRDQSLHVTGPKYVKGKGKQQKNQKTKFDALRPRVENQQYDESSGSRKNKGKGHNGKEKVKCSYCGKGFHPEHACMKKNIDEATSLLERNHINIPDSFRRRDHQDQEPQHEKGHSLMESTSKSKALLIDSGSLNHMMAEKDSFSSLETSKSIPIHMGDDSTIMWPC